VRPSLGYGFSFSLSGSFVLGRAFTVLCRLVSWNPMRSNERSLHATRLQLLDDEDDITPRLGFERSCWTRL
jgi:hypothetical protein